jgi:hypothetical protein
MILGKLPYIVEFFFSRFMMIVYAIPLEPLSLQ